MRVRYLTPLVLCPRISWISEKWMGENTVRILPSSFFTLLRPARRSSRSGKMPRRAGSGAMMVSLSFSPELRGDFLLDLRDGDRRKEFGKKEKKEQEEAEGADGDAQLHPAGLVEPPVVRDKILGHGTDDDHESLGIH